MKTLLPLTLIFFGSVALAQNASNVSTPPANAPLRLVVPEDPVQLQPPLFEVTAGWSEKTKDGLSVPLNNTGDQPMTVLGVQATRGIFVVNYPNKIKAGGSDTINFIYEAADNSDGDMEVIRVKTDQGIKVIHLKITREVAVSFDAKQLKWKTGASADTKIVNLQIPSANLIPVSAKVSSGGHQAVIEKVDGKNYRVKITPASTARATQFVVSVQFDHPVPGTAPVILCVIAD